MDISLQEHPTVHIRLSGQDCIRGEEGCREKQANDLLMWMGSIVFSFIVEVPLIVRIITAVIIDIFITMYIQFNRYLQSAACGYHMPENRQKLLATQ